MAGPRAGLQVGFPSPRTPGFRRGARASGDWEGVPAQPPSPSALLGIPRRNLGARQGPVTRRTDHPVQRRGWLRPARPRPPQAPPTTGSPHLRLLPPRAHPTRPLPPQAPSVRGEGSPTWGRPSSGPDLTLDKWGLHSSREPHRGALRPSGPVCIRSIGLRASGILPFPHSTPQLPGVLRG